MGYIPTSLGFCFGTVLMRSAVEEVYYNSLLKSLTKNHFYLVSIGDNIEEEKFWIKGRELFTLYTNIQGFQILTNSMLEEELLDRVKEEDMETIKRFFDSGRPLNKEYPFYQVKTIPTLFHSLDDCINALKPLNKEITIYSIQTKNKPYYLEEIRHYSPKN